MVSHDKATVAAPVPSDDGGTKRLRRACNVCHRMKLRCSGTNPCARCQDTGGDCVYAFTAKLGKPRGSRNKKTIEREKLKQQDSTTLDSLVDDEDTASPSPPSPPRSLSKRSVLDIAESSNSEEERSGNETGMDWNELLNAVTTPPSSLDMSFCWLDESNGENSIPESTGGLEGKPPKVSSSINTQLLETLQSHWSGPLEAQDIMNVDSATPVPTAQYVPGNTKPGISTQASCGGHKHFDRSSCNCLQVQFETLCNLRAADTRTLSNTYFPLSPDTDFVVTLNALSTLQGVLRCPCCRSDCETTELIIMTVDLVFRRLQCLLSRSPEAILTDMQLNLGGQKVLGSEPLALVRQALLTLLRERAQQAVQETRSRMGMLGANAGADLEEALKGDPEKMYAIKLRMASMRLDTMLHQIQSRLS